MSEYERLDWYDLPHYYDVVYDEDTPQEADFLQAVHKRYANALPGPWLEPACGTGRLLRELARRGEAVYGFDGNQAMVEYAREHAPAIAGSTGVYRVEKGDLADFFLGTGFAMAFCLVSTFKYILREADAVSHLRAVARSLSVGGVYALGLHLTDYADRQADRERWTGERDGTFVRVTLNMSAADVRRRREKVLCHVDVRNPDGTERRLESSWEFRTYDAAQLRRVLRAVPELELIAVHDFGFDLDRANQLEDDQLDSVLVLRRR